MLKYYINHPKSFSKILKTDDYGNLSVEDGPTNGGACWEPLVINLMQLIAGAFTEYISIRLMCAQDSEIDTVMNFFALSIIHEIDNLYFNSLSNELPLKKALSDAAPQRTQSTKWWRYPEKRGSDS